MFNMKSKMFLKYFAHSIAQILRGIMLEFPLKLYLHSLIFVLRLTWSKNMMLRVFEKFRIIDVLHKGTFT